MKILFLLVVSAVFAAPIAISQAGSSAPIIIGISNVQSGPSRTLGLELVRGSKAYFDEVNHSGGVHGRQVSLLVMDDRYEPDPAVQNTNDLIVKDNAFLLFDYVGTPTLTRILPLLSYYRDRSIINVAPLTGAEAPRKPPYGQYVFNIRASYREETLALVNYLYAKGFRKIGFFGQADSYGKIGEIGVEEALKRHGLSVVASAAYRRNSEALNMQFQVDYLRGKGADAIIAIGTYGPCSKFIRDARMSHWQVPIANVSFVNADALLVELRAASRTVHQDLTGNLINSQVVPSPDSVEYPLVKAYLAHLGYQSAGFTSLEGWMNAAVVAEALRRAGPDPSRSSFITALESLNGWDPGIGCKLQFGQSEHKGLNKVWLTRTQNAVWVPEREGSN